jgi:hypothetical protein
MSSEGQWRRFCVLVPILAGLAVVLMAFTGRFLPRPFGDYNPMDSAVMRIAEIRQHAVEDAAPCIMLLGDSRMAFGVNGAQLKVGSCAARNFGFPAIGYQILGLAKEVSGMGRRPRVIVLGVTEQTTFVDGATFPREGRRKLDTNPSFWMRISGSRRVVAARLNLLRYAALFRYLQGAAPLPSSSGWVWDEQLGRWSAGFDAATPLDSHPLKREVLENIARSYFQGRRSPVDLDEMLQHLVAQLKSMGDIVVLFIPPQHPDFKVLADAMAPGQQQLMRESVARVGERTGSIVVDCLGPEACGVRRADFIDPVHLKAGGAEAITNELARKLAPALSAATK